MLQAFEVEQRSDFAVDDDDDGGGGGGDDGDGGDGEVIVRHRVQTANPLADAAALPSPREPRQASPSQTCRDDPAQLYVAISEVVVGDADWCVVFESGPQQKLNRAALAECLVQRGLVVKQSIAGGRGEVFVRISAREDEALRIEAERIGLMRELDPGSVVLAGREKTATELAETGKPRLYGPDEARPVTVQEDTQQARYGFHRYTRKKDHFFARHSSSSRFHTGERQVLVKSLVEKALNDYYIQLQTHGGAERSQGSHLHQLLSASHSKGQPATLQELCDSGSNPAFCKDIFPERSPAELESLRMWANWRQLQFWKPHSSVSDLTYVPLDAIVSEPTGPSCYLSCCCCREKVCCLYPNPKLVLSTL
jgi:hypothetical protein